MAKIGWILLGDRNVASSRIHGLNIHTYFLRNGLRSKILQSCTRMCPRLTIPVWKRLFILISGYDVIIFQKVYDEKAIRFAKMAKWLGIKTIFLQSDAIDSDMVRTVDCVVVSSDYLAQYYRAKYGIKNIVVIEDAVESSGHAAKRHIDKKPLEIVWVGDEQNWCALEVVDKALDKIGEREFSLKRISNHKDADIRWRLETVFDEIVSADIAVIPSLSDDWYMSKSNNRLTMFMALGMPVIATPVPSYKTILKHGYNGFFAENINEWEKCLDTLKNVKSRADIGARARQEVIQKYNIESIGKQWLELLTLVTGKRLYAKS